MKLRSIIYFHRKKVQKYLKSPLGKLTSVLQDDLAWYGMAGTRTFLAEDGNVKVERLSYREINELQDKVRKGETIGEEITLGGEYLVSPEMKTRIDELRKQFKNPQNLK